TRARPASAARRYEVGLALTVHRELDGIADAHAAEGLAADKHGGTAIDHRHIARRGHRAGDRRAGRHEAAAHLRHTVPGANVLRAVLHRHEHAVADREALLAHRAGRVLTAQVESLAELTDAQRHHDVAARSIQCDEHAARRLLAPLLDEGELLEVQHAVRTIRASRC